MNYIAEINTFNRLITGLHISPTEQSLWYALMALSNSICWKKNFTVSLDTLVLRTNLSRNGILKARKRLAELGLIKFSIPPKGTTRYELISLAENFPLREASVPNCEPDCEPDCEPGREPDCEPGREPYREPLNKQDKKEENKTISFSDMIDGFTSDLSLRLSLSRFINFRNRSSSPFTRHSFRLFLLELKSFGDVDKMNEAINCSLKNGWKSLVRKDPPGNTRSFDNFKHRGFDYSHIEQKSLCSH